jgi:competence ComEA-like helix-hairpin-helix protein
MNEQRIEEQREVPTGPPEEAPPAVPKVDLNTASADELAQLPGVGPRMAKRIIEYREEVGPFEEPEDLMAVPGIARETYRRLSDRLTVSPVAQPPVEEGQPRPTIGEVEERIHTMKAEIEAVSTALLGTPPGEEEKPPAEGEEPPPPTELEHPVKEERAEVEKPPPREPPPLREVPPEVRPPAVAPPPAPSAWRGGFTWLAAASLIGAVMGAILALLVIGGINGTLDLNQRAAVVELRAEGDRLSGEAKAIQTDLDGLRERLDALEGLTGRLDDVERDVEDLASGLAEAQTDIVTLDARADALDEDIATVRAAADRFNAFLDGLRDLLFEFQGAPPTPTPVLSEVEGPTPTPTATPRPARTPRATPTPGK